MKTSLAIAAAALAFATPAISAVQGIEAVPTAWRLENYTGDVVYIHGTGLACGSPHFGAGWSSDDRNRLWALVTTAKIASKVVGIRYEDSNCEIVSFFFKES